MALMKNGVVDTTVSSHGTAVNANLPFVLSTSGIIKVSPNDVIGVGLLNHSGSSQLMIDHLSLTIVRIDD